MLLTSLLASIVLLALWSLSDIYLKLFVTGKRKIEETQLVRGLTSQFAKDISEVIQLPEETSASNLFSRFTPGETRSPSAELGLPQRRTTVSNDPSAQTTSNSSSNPNEEDRVSSNRPKPRFGLFGTKHALRLIVLEADPRATREPTDLADVLPQPGSLRHPAAPELRTIEYSFASGYGSNAAGGQQLPSGLVRREWAWETWAGLRLANPSNAGSENSSNMLPETNESWTSQETLIPGADMSFDNIPSVIRLEFHYYDGEKWQSEWDSWEKRKLPLLVEVLFQVRVNKDQSVAVDTEEEESDSYSEDLASEDASTRRDPLYRQLIHLPLGESQSSFDDFPRDQSMTDFATTVPRIGGRRP